MSPLVERVARAIYEERSRAILEVMEVDREAWHELPEWMRDEYCDEGRAAIRAIHETEIVQALEWAHATLGVESREASQLVREVYAQWRAAIVQLMDELRG